MHTFSQTLILLPISNNPFHQWLHSSDGTTEIYRTRTLKVLSHWTHVAEQVEQLVRQHVSESFHTSDVCGDKVCMTLASSVFSMCNVPPNVCQHVSECERFHWEAWSHSQTHVPRICVHILGHMLPNKLSNLFLNLFGNMCPMWKHFNSGEKAFSVSGPSHWNSLPQSVYRVRQNKVAP